MYLHTEGSKKQWPNSSFFITNATACAANNTVPLYFLACLYLPRYLYLQ